LSGGFFGKWDSASTDNQRSTTLYDARGKVISRKTGNQTTVGSARNLGPSTTNR